MNTSTLKNMTTERIKDEIGHTFLGYLDHTFIREVLPVMKKQALINLYKNLRLIDVVNTHNDLYKNKRLGK